MLKLKVKEVLETSGIQYPAKWLMRFCDFDESKAYNIINNKKKSLTLNDLSKMCENLNCTPDQLFYWDNEGHDKVPDDHPLRTVLTKPDKTTNWFSLFKKLTRDKIAAMQKKFI